MQRPTALPAAAAALVAAAFALGVAASVAAETVGDGRPAMGTVLEIELVALDARTAREAIDASFRLVEELEAVLSSHRPESDVSRVSRAAGTGPSPVASPVTDLLKRAVDYWRLTGGAFDVTVGPLVTLWTEAGRSGRLPSGAALASAHALVGSDALELHPDGTVELARPGMSIDLGGIAKGFALDRVASRLQELGFSRGLLSFGQSSVLALGAPPGARGWRLLLRTPDGGFAGVIALRDRAFSVSSTLGKFNEIEGRRFGHVIDPRTGLPKTSGAQVAVVAADATRAEALSTALLVLDRAEGRALVESLPDAEAFWIDELGAATGSSGWSQTSGFEPLGVATDVASPPR